ncbi:MAG: hypothetical protein L6Q37_12350, partial [Bdellovibrionaceae bacterium]|nr:hypothetical protein [Pseudobdellovibrionaceae bacterium]
MKFLILTVLAFHLSLAQVGITQKNSNQNILTANRLRFYSPNAQEALLKYQFTVEVTKAIQPTESEFKTA